jgi:hypothetical protein
VSFSLDPFRARQVTPRFPRELKDLHITVPPDWPRFQPERHVTNFKGKDAVAFVILCQWASEHPKIRSEFRNRPNAVAELVNIMRRNQLECADLAERHPEIMMRELGMEMPLSPEEREDIEMLVGVLSVQRECIVEAYLKSGRDAGAVIDLLGKATSQRE